MGYNMNGETLNVNISVDTTQYARHKAQTNFTKLTKQKPQQASKVAHTGYLVPVGKTQPRKQAKIAKVGQTHHNTKHAEAGRVSYNFDLKSGIQYVKNLFNPNQK